MNIYYIKKYKYVIEIILTFFSNFYQKFNYARKIPTKKATYCSKC